MSLRLPCMSLSISMLVLITTVVCVAQTQSYNNNAAITINALGSAATYPSTISVPAVCCVISKATVTLNGFSHTLPDDVGVLLVAPGGQKIRLMTDNGGNTVASNINITFDDAAAAALPNTGGIPSGTYKPTLGTVTGGGAVHPNNFSAPAPAAPYSVLLSDLIGTSPTGTWSLYVDDDTATNAGSIANGWTLTITLGQTFSNTAAITVPGSGTGPAVASPYPSGIAVSGIMGSVTKVKVKLNNFTHTFWDDVGILLVGPLGQKVLLTSDNGGANDASGDYVFDDAAGNAIPDNAVVVPTTYRPSLDGANQGGSVAMPASFPAPAPAPPYVNTLSAFNALNPNGTWNLYFYDDTAADLGTVAGGWTLIIESTAPTAADVIVSGRVTNSSGRGIANARVLISGGLLPEERVVITNPFGYFKITGVPSGASYLIMVSSKNHWFEQPAQVISLNDNVTDLNFQASP